MTPRAPAALIAVLTLALAGCGGSNARRHDGASTFAQRFGFNDTPYPRSLALQASLRMPIRRYPVPWNRVEPRPGRWNWAYFDRTYASVLADGLRPLLVAVGAPCWSQNAYRCNPVGPPAARFLSAWAVYTRRLARRYPLATGIEIWNEPNAAQWFWPRPNPAQYTPLLKAAYAAIKGVDPRMSVVSGGLLPAPANGPHVVADWQFLAAMYKAGAGGSMDAVGAHPYPVASSAGGTVRYSPRAMEQDLARLRTIDSAAGGHSTPIWITETGVSTGYEAGFPPAATAEQQSALLLSMIRAVRGRRDIPVVIVHRLIDVPATPPVSVESDFGVFYANGAPKPAACALSQQFHGSLRC